MDINIPKTIVIGLGNPILGDDGIGWHVLNYLVNSLPPQSFPNMEIKFEYFAEGGLRLMELMIGYDNAVIIDALNTYQMPTGSVLCLPLENLPNFNSEHITSPHNTSLQTSLHFGREIGLHLPQKVYVIGIEAQKLYEFSEVLSPQVQKAVPLAAKKAIELLENIHQEIAN